MGEGCNCDISKRARFALTHTRTHFTSNFRKKTTKSLHVNPSCFPPASLVTINDVFGLRTADGGGNKSLESNTATMSPPLCRWPRGDFIDTCVAFYWTGFTLLPWSLRGSRRREKHPQPFMRSSHTQLKPHGPLLRSALNDIWMTCTAGHAKSNFRKVGMKIGSNCRLAARTE